MHWDAGAVALLKFLHVAFAAVWVGGTLYVTAVVAPVLGESTPPTRREFFGRLTPRVVKLGNIVGGTTILTGLAFLYARNDGFAVVGRKGQLVMAGLLAALSVLFLLNYSMRPASRALAQLQAKDAPGTPPSQAQLLLLRKIQFSGRASLVILVGALLAMVWAATAV